jgi:hypothetical protein
MRVVPGKEWSYEKKKEWSYEDEVERLMASTQVRGAMR